MNRITIATVLFLLSACGENAALEPQRMARASFDGRDYSAARDAADLALKAEPSSQEMILLKARSCIALGDGAGALATLARLPEDARRAEGVRETQALALLRSRKPEPAVAALEGLATVEADRLRAMAALQSGDMARARRLLESAAARGGSGLAFADYARILMIANEAAAAKTMADKALSLAPDEPMVLQVAGEVEALSGRNRAALELYEKALRLDPGNMGIRIDRAWAYADLKQWAALETALVELEGEAPGTPEFAAMRQVLVEGRKGTAH